MSGGKSNAQLITILKVGLIVFFVFIFIPQTSSAANLQDLLNKQNSLQQQAKQTQQQIVQNKQQASNLQDAINSLNGNISTTNGQISNTQNQIQTTNAIIQNLDGQIQDTQNQLNDLNTKLNKAYDNLYELSQTNTLELLFQSKSINDLLNQSQYIESLQTNLQQDINQANQLQNDLQSKKQTNENQKANLQNLNSQLTQSVNSLNAQKAEKNTLLQQTQGQEAQYEALLKSLQSDISVVNSQIVKIYEEAASASRNLTTGGTGGYPYAGSAMDLPDPWDFLTRECTSYVAWKWNSVYGYQWLRNPLPADAPSGNAKYWVAIARDRGFKVSSVPVARAVAVWSGGNFGHVAIVEQVLSDGSFLVSEYNFSPPFGGQFDTRITTVGGSSMGVPSFIYPPGA